MGSRIEIDPFERGGGTARIVGVSLHQTGHIYNYLSGDFDFRRGARVVVDTEAGVRLATIEVEPHDASVTLDTSGLKPVLRVAGYDDLRIEAENLEREAQAQRLCLERIRSRGLAMKLVTAEYSYDARKLTFYFVAEERVDFRDLVRDLADTLRVRIELKQIGARDESKVTGAVGPCGRELCCSSWLRDFETVTVKMAREQGLALNPSRLAGMCGRLKCCLRYEYATYLELKRELPPIGRRVESVKGDGNVVRHNILKQTVLIEREEDGGVIEAALDDLVAKRG